MFTWKVAAPLMLFTGWHVGRIKSKRGTILYPPVQICTTRHRPVGVLTGLSIRPGDQARSVLNEWAERLGYPVDDLVLEYQD